MIRNVHRRAIGTAAALALGLSLGAGCSDARSGATAPTDAPAATQSRTILRGDFERDLLLTGELQAVHSIEIKGPQTSLFQLRIQFMAEEGAVVRAGETLLEFDNSSLTDQVRDLETQILDARTQIVSKKAAIASSLKDLEIELAQKEYDHGYATLEAAVDPDILSRKEYAERQLALTKAARELAETRERIALTRNKGQSELDVLIINHDKLEKDMINAQTDRERLTILAPSDGLVVYERRQNTTMRYQEGDSCWPGQAVMRLPDLSEMRVEFFVNEVDAPLLALGMPVRVKLDSFPRREITGVIDHIPSMAVKRDESSKVAVFRVRATLDETWIGEMKPGMSALGRITLERRSDAPLVARHAVEYVDGEYRLRRSGDGPTVKFEPVARNEKYYLVDEETYLALGGPTATVRQASGGAGR